MCLSGCQWIAARYSRLWWWIVINMTTVRHIMRCVNDTSLCNKLSRLGLRYYGRAWKFWDWFKMQGFRAEVEKMKALRILLCHIRLTGLFSIGNRTDFMDVYFQTDVINNFNIWLLEDASNTVTSRILKNLASKVQCILLSSYECWDSLNLYIAITNRIWMTSWPARRVLKEIVSVSIIIL